MSTIIQSLNRLQTCIVSFFCEITSKSRVFVVPSLLSWMGRKSHIVHEWERERDEGDCWNYPWPTKWNVRSVAPTLSLFMPLRKKVFIIFWWKHTLVVTLVVTLDASEEDCSHHFHSKDCLSLYMSLICLYHIGKVKAGQKYKVITIKPWVTKLTNNWD